MSKRDINDAHPRLQLGWRYVDTEWSKRYPSDPKPFLGEVYRSDDEQRALYAQGRRPISEVNRLRQVAGLALISEVENRKKVTNATPGKSKHNVFPSRAMDVYFAEKKVLVYTPRLYEQLYALLKEVVPEIKWGKFFAFVDTPHFEI